MYQDMITAIMEAKRKAQLEGRPLSAEEVRGITGGYFEKSANRNLQNRELDFREKNAADQLALERWRMQKMLESAGSSNNNQLISNLLKTGGSLYGLSLLK
ncbi:MAG: hypothetical protein PHS33_07660 [Candidatus Omnitrophica bacterium]|nr:hypothetical protein [Candidatus Omnitrophota bacterium]